MATRYNYSHGTSQCYTYGNDNDSRPNDPYVYANGVLKNLFGIRDEAELASKEKEILAKKVVSTELVRSHKLDLELLQSIHRYIFQEIYEWAGTIRTCHIEKEEKFFIPGLTLRYPEPPEIVTELKKKIYHLNSVRWSELTYKEIVEEFARRIAQLWKIHAFRDGNTRAIIGFAKVYAIERGFPFDVTVLTNRLSHKRDENGKILNLSTRDMFVGATLDEAPDDKYLINLFSEAMKG